MAAVRKTRNGILRGAAQKMIQKETKAVRYDHEDKSLGCTISDTRSALKSEKIRAE